MDKRMKKMLIALGVLFGCIILYKGFSALMLSYYLSHSEVTLTVSTAKTTYTNWQPKLTATGSLRAIQGVNVTTELAAMVKQIYFVPGSMVKQGELLVQLNADSDIAQLHSLQANAKLALLTFNRDKAQFKVHAVSKQTLDNDEGNLNSLNAQVAQQVAIVNKKTIRAPFSGRLGISQINPGQYLNPGDQIVMLQTLNPIYVDFLVPQQALAQLKVNQLVSLTSDSFPKQVFHGKITTINPAVDVDSRNVEVEATINNNQNQLTPGMFANVEVTVGANQKYLTVPQTAVTYNPYGNIVYIVRQEGKDKKGKPLLIAKQAFVNTGEIRGDQVAITRGLKLNDTVVTSGQLKLKNGSPVTINNEIKPSDNPEPLLSNDHEG